MNKLQERRVFLGLTQPDVSRELRKVDPRMDVGMVSRFERGACLPTTAVLKRLTEVLQASVSDLYSTEDMAAMGFVRILRKAHRNGRKVLRLAKRRERMHRLLCCRKRGRGCIRRGGRAGER